MFEKKKLQFYCYLGILPLILYDQFLLIKKKIELRLVSYFTASANI